MPPEIKSKLITPETTARGLIQARAAKEIAADPIGQKPTIGMEFILDEIMEGAVKIQKAIDKKRLEGS